MDSIKNPFSPNAGSRPPELVGRDDVLELARVMIGRTQLRRSVQNLLMTGLRGVGKTVVLTEILRNAERDNRIIPIYIEASEHKRLGELLAAPLKLELLKLDRVDGAKKAAKKGLSVLRNFLGTIKITFGDVGIELEPHPGEGDSGDMQYDLMALLSAVAEAAAERDKAIILMIDEVQYLKQEELEALVMSMHHMQQRQLPMAMVGVGLPILAKLAGEAKSYAERLFKYPTIGALSEEQTRQALVAPLDGEGVEIEDGALEVICKETGGYPFFIQEWGSQLWNYVEAGPITLEDVERVRSVVMTSLDTNFFMIRMERLTAAEKRFLMSMAEVADKLGECKISDVAARMGVVLQTIGPCRSSLIKKGMIYGSGHGLVSFTVPMFGDYLIRHQVGR